MADIEKMKADFVASQQKGTVSGGASPPTVAPPQAPSATPYISPTAPAPMPITPIQPEPVYQPSAPQQPIPFIEPQQYQAPPVPQAKQSRPLELPTITSAVDMAINPQGPKPIEDVRNSPENIGDFVHNAWLDIQNLGKGVGVLGAVSAQRMADTILPKGLYSEAERRKNWMDAALPKGLVQFGRVNADGQVDPGDFNKMREIASGIFKHYQNSYFEPVLKGDFNKIGQTFLQRPIEVTSDLLPLGGPVGKALGVAGKATGASAKLAQVGSNISKAASKTPVVGAVIENIQAANAVKELLRMANAEFLAEAAPLIKDLQALYKAIPEQYRKDLYKAAEYTDPQLYHSLVAASPAIQPFLQKANEINNLLAEKLVKTGLISDLDVKMAKYGPATLARYGPTATDANGALRPITRMDQLFGSIDATGQLIGGHPLAGVWLDIVKNELQAAGIEPVYVRNVNQATSTASNNLAGSLFAKLPGTFAAKPGFAFQRQGETLLESARGDIFKAIKGGILEEMAYLKMRDVIEQSLSHPGIVKSASTTGVNVHEFLKKAAKNAGIAEDQMAAMISSVPETSTMPAWAANKLEASLRNIGWKGWDAWGNFYKSNVLGLNPMWVVNQSVQNSMIGNAAMFKSPRDVATSLMAYALALQEPMAQSLPPHLLQELKETSTFREHFQNARAAINEKINPELTRGWEGPPSVPTPVMKHSGLLQAATANSLASILAAYSGVTERVFNAAARSDNYFRAVKGLHSIMRQVEVEIPATRIAFYDAFNTMKRQEQIIQGVRNKAVLETAAKDILRWYGDYSSLAAKEAWIQRKFLPFYLWNQHALSVAIALPTQSPVKNALLNQIYLQAPELFQRGVAPEFKKLGAINVQGKGPNELPLYNIKTGFTPFMQTYSTILLAADMAGWEHSSGQFLPFHPAINTAIMGIYGINPSSGQNFKDPNLIPLPGGQQGIRKGDRIEIVKAHLPLPNLMVRSTMPGVEKRAREAMADIEGAIGYGRPKMASDFTTWGDPAIQKNQSFPEGRNAWPLWMQGVNAMTGGALMTPTEASMPSGKASQLDRSQQAKFRQAERRYSKYNPPRK